MQEDYTKEFNNDDKLVGGIYEIFETLVFAIAFVIFIFTFIAKLSIVSGESMLNTLRDKDYLIASNVFFSYEPESGDIVVVEPEHYNETLVKRVIATGGQKVKIVYSDDLGTTANRTYDVYVDGVLLEEEYAFYSVRRIFIEPTGPAWSKTSNGSLITATTVVPENHIFVMGDNRNNSKDSRSQDIEFIHEDDVLGKCVFRIFPNTKIL